MDEPNDPNKQTEPNVIQRLSKDLAKAAMTLSKDEARFLVDYYYISQRDRIRAGNQVRALNESGEPHDVLNWLNTQSGVLESQIRRALGKYAESSKTGLWLLGVTGIGPVISAGLLANIDIHKAETAGDIWRFAGLDPTNKWNKGEKRPWNSSLKTLCWKIGESFVKVKGKEEGRYGQLYAVRKEYEQAKNERGEYADRAAEVLKMFPAHKQKETYAEGKLPDGHIHARAKRFAVKIFLSHLHQKWREHEGLPIVAPYAIAILGHGHMLNP
jgi:hypothetical protein